MNDKRSGKDTTASSASGHNVSRDLLLLPFDKLNKATNRRTILFFLIVLVFSVPAMLSFTLDTFLVECQRDAVAASSNVTTVRGSASTDRVVGERSNTHEKFRDISIALMGDSLTRYQYLSLVYFLRWGAWFDPDKMHPHLTWEASFQSPLHKHTWMECFWQTNRMLAPFETCDCFRPGAAIKHRLHQVCENRYYHDPERNVSVTYIQAYGHASSQHGHYNASTILTASSTDKKSIAPLSLELAPYKWTYDTWDATIRFHVAELRPKPQIVVLNAGIWSNNFLAQNDTRKALLDALKDTGMRGIWKTTTPPKKGNLPPNQVATDELMCEQLGTCLNVSWTAELNQSLYWDNYHYFEPVYRWINEQMLDMILS